MNFPPISHNRTFEDKVESARRLAFQMLSNLSCYVSVSGGKDSMIVWDIVQEIAPGTPGAFANTGVEDPRTIEFMKQFTGITWLDPLKSFWTCIEQYGWPKQKGQSNQRGNHCCKYLKEGPLDRFARAGNFTGVLDGLTADESRQRWMTLGRTGPIYRQKTREIVICHPLYDWTEEDAWRYIRERNLATNPVYETAGRCGCLPCTAFNSWIPTLAKQNPKMLTFIMKEKLGQTQLEVVTNPLSNSC